GDTMLYATAATVGRVDGFCVNRGGALTPGASVHADTGVDPSSPGVHDSSSNPRRLLVGNGVLYVGEHDRVEAFSIGPHGGLKFLNRTALISSPAMDVMDMALSPDGKTLYVAQNGPDRIAGYSLDATGVPARDFSSCIQGRVNVSYRALRVSNSLLYVSEQLTPGRIAVFPIDAGGGLGPCSAQRSTVCQGGSRAGQMCSTEDANATTGCPGATCPGCCVAATRPISERRRIQRPRPFVIMGDRLYVDEVGTARIKGFGLQADGLFSPPTMVGKRLRWEKPFSRTDPVLAYVDVVLFRSTLLASQFEKGRIDAYRLTPDGRLPHQPTRRSNQDVRTSPVRMTVSEDGVLYVAAGELDRVEAFRLRQSDGLLASATPFSQTDEQTGSFPNDVALAMLSG